MSMAGVPDMRYVEEVYGGDSSPAKDNTEDRDTARDVCFHSHIPVHCIDTQIKNFGVSI
jgi:hypothetical protein